VSVRLRESAEFVEVRWWTEAPTGGRPVYFADLAAARAFFGRLGARAGNLQALRRFVADHLPAATPALGDAALVDRAASWLMLGTIAIQQKGVQPVALGRRAAAEQAVRGTSAGPAPTPAAPEAEEPALPGANLDQVQQARTLEKAAETAAPLVEECALPGATRR
jgi:hypothetical protein